MEAERSRSLLALRSELTSLQASCGGDFAGVIDEGNLVWCLTRHEYPVANRFYVEEIAPNAISMRRGKSLRVEKQPEHHDHGYVAQSFASIYVVVVWFARPFSAELAHRQVRARVQKIEQIVLSTPPPFGPETGEAAGKSRA